MFEEEVALSLYCVLTYLHQYPTSAGIGLFVFGKSKRRFSKKKFYECALTTLMMLATLGGAPRRS